MLVLKKVNEDVVVSYAYIYNKKKLITKLFNYRNKLPKNNKILTVLQNWINI